MLLTNTRIIQTTDNYGCATLSMVARLAMQWLQVNWNL